MSKSPLIEKTPLMEKYEEETGKLAVWKGELSKHFKKWKIKKEKEEVKQRREEILSASRNEKKKIKQDIKDDKTAGKDYEHLILVENLHKMYLLGTLTDAKIYHTPLVFEDLTLVG